MKKFEYAEEFCLHSDYARSLSEMGEEGWELVTIIPNMARGDAFIFKREKSTDDQA